MRWNCFRTPVTLRVPVTRRILISAEFAGFRSKDHCKTTGSFLLTLLTYLKSGRRAGSRLLMLDDHQKC
eukprot:scaffold12982_cov129-Cylindrotheca_fusiformis.AAC.9